MLPPSREAFGQSEYSSVLECINYYRDNKEDPPYDGIYQKRLEQKFANKMNSGYAIAVNSGSSASYIALKAIGLKKGAKVLLSPVTDSSSFSSIILAGYKPVVLDTEVDSYNTSLEQIIKAWDRNVKAIYLVHTYGVICKDIEKIVDYCQKNKILLIEDCSQAPFAYRETQDGKKYAGEYGSIACFSSMYRKTFNTSSSGGIVFTKHQTLYQKAVEYSDRGRKKWDLSINAKDGGDIDIISHNFNTSEISCAIGISSLERIETAINKRCKLVKYLIEHISRYNKFVKLMDFPTGSSPFLVPITFTEQGSTLRNKLFREFEGKNIPFAKSYPCFVHDWKIVKKFYSKKSIMGLNNILRKNVYQENASKLKQNTFNLYLHENYTEEYLNYVLTCFECLQS